MILQAYRKEWAEDFTALKQIRELALTGKKVSIEHVGSTSIPMLAAKPIIDIDIMRRVRILKLLKRDWKG